MFEWLFFFFLKDPSQQLMAILIIEWAVNIEKGVYCTT